MKLDYLRENPDNPQGTTDEKMARLVGRLRRVPEGLKAMRIAYITDDPRFPGRGMVLSGNKRLVALRGIYGANAELPDDWFQDITALTPEQRKEFIIDANTTDGAWNVSRLLEQYEEEQLNTLLGEETLDEILKSHVEASDYSEDFSLPDRKEHTVREISILCDARQYDYILRVLHENKREASELNGDVLERVLMEWEEQGK